MRRRKAPTSFLREMRRFFWASHRHTFRQSVPLTRECLRYAPATVAAKSETHSDGSRGRSEIRCASPCPPSFGWSQPRAERRLGECVCCPIAQTPALAEHAAVWAAVPMEYLRPHLGRGSLCRPIRSDRPLARWPL